MFKTLTIHGSGKKILINFDNVIEVTTIEVGIVNRTRIFYIGNDYRDVTESFSTIQKMLEGEQT